MRIAGRRCVPTEGPGFQGILPRTACVPGNRRGLVARSATCETRAWGGSIPTPPGPGPNRNHDDDGEHALKENPVKRALRAGKPQIGTWLTLGSVAAARFMARVGLPWLTVDMEHTHTDIQTAGLHVRRDRRRRLRPAGPHPHRQARVHQDGPRLRRHGDRRADGHGRRRGPGDRRGDQVSARAATGPSAAACTRSTSAPRPRNTTAAPTTRSSSSSRPSTSRPSKIADEIYSVPGIDAVFVGPNDLNYSMRSADGTFPEQGDVRGDPHPHPRGGQAQRRPVRAPRVLRRRRPPPRPRRLAVHRRQQRAEDDARRCRRPHEAGQRRAPIPRIWRSIESDLAMAPDQSRRPARGCGSSPARMTVSGSCAQSSRLNSSSDSGPR